MLEQQGIIHLVENGKIYDDPLLDITGNCVENTQVRLVTDEYNPAYYDMPIIPNENVYSVGAPRVDGYKNNKYEIAAHRAEKNWKKYIS